MKTIMENVALFSGAFAGLVTGVLTIFYKVWSSYLTFRSEQVLLGTTMDTLVHVVERKKKTAALMTMGWKDPEVFESEEHMRKYYRNICFLDVCTKQTQDGAFIMVPVGFDGKPVKSWYARPRAHKCEDCVGELTVQPTLDTPTE